MTRSKLERTNRWIAVDWGTSNLRVWFMEPSGKVIEQRSSAKGMGGLSRNEFEPAFLELASDFLTDGEVTQVFVCGMAGAAEGWAEAGYAATPCKPSAENKLVSVPTIDARIRVKILPGVKQPSPPDVMRGEETQIAGYLSLNPGFEGILCLPGTHTKWVEISQGAISRFKTFMTGEIFAFLVTSSVLKHIVSPNGWNDDAFATGVEGALNGTDAPIGYLFSLRAEALIANLSPVAARARLSGHLIGVELFGTRSFWQGKDVVIIGDDGISKTYVAALKLQNVSAVLVPAETMTLAGLCSARSSARSA